ncbi:FtsX-like permease family protein [Kitasatospora sp. NPDC056184]|uniref:FtsX-like permease family protein n=1 Tax=Kitasatospora sp. NPDC056184 TaxID=3345738 RepID=UPI0035DC4A36
MKLSALRVALRIARRDALRAKGRSALIAAMVALPVLGVAGADVVHRSGQLTPGERVERLMGGADALITAHRPGRSVDQGPFAEDGVQVLPENRTDPASVTAAAAAGSPAELVAGLLPAGAVLLPTTPGPAVSTSTREGLFTTATAEADLADRIWQGRIDLVEGRAPNASHEAAVTRAFLAEAGLRIGDSTTVKGLDKAPFKLTGVVEYPGTLDKVELVARPGELIAPLAAAAPPGAAPSAGLTAAGADTDRPERWLVRMPGGGAALDWPAVRKLNRYGFTVTSRAVALDPPPASAVTYDPDLFRLPDADKRVVVLATVVGMALLEVALLAGPAFAVGARRSRRQLALIGAAGGNRGHVRAVVLGSGLVLGTVGAAVGLVAGVGLVALLRTRAEEAGGSRFGHFAIAPLDLLAIAAVGVVTALLAAVVPAVQAARRDVVAGLTGRDAVGAPSRRLPLLGGLLVVAGAGLALYGAGSPDATGLPVFKGLTMKALTVLAGAVTAELGFLLFTPLLVALFGRLAARLPIGPRLALRDSARHRGRTAPAVAAVMAAVAGAVAVGVYTTGTEAQDRASYRPTAPMGAVVVEAPMKSDDPRLPRLRAAVERGLPDAGTRADVQSMLYVFCTGCSSTVQVKGTGGGRFDRGGAGSRALVGDATVLRNLFGVNDRAAEEALAAGRAIVFDRDRVQDGRAVLTMLGAAGGGPVQPGETPQTGTKEIAVDALLVDDPEAARYGGLLMSPDAVRKVGLSTESAGSVWRPAHPPTAKAQQRVEADLAQVAPLALLHVERGFQPKDDVISLALAGFAVLVVLGAAAVATGLAAADSRNDRATLAAVGAPPRIHRVQAGLQSTLIAGLGAAIGTVSGLVPAVALLRSHASGQIGVPAAPFTAPWGLLVTITVVLPVVAGLGAALFTRSRLPLARRAG